MTPAAARDVPVRVARWHGATRWPAMLGVGAVALVAAVLAPTPATAYSPPGRTERVSLSSGGVQGASYSAWKTAISGSGRFVAFASRADNLVPGDTNGTWDVFVRDRDTGITERVSLSSDGREGNELSTDPALSADGRYVVFSSHATNLVSGDTNGFKDVFVHSRETGTTERVSVASDGGEGNGSSGNFGASISADGRYVAFASTASTLVPGDTNGGDVIWDQDAFVHDRVTGTTERISLASDGSQTEAHSSSVPDSVSADGRYVSFTSDASNLAPGDTNARYDVFVHDRETGATERVSVAGDGTGGAGTGGDDHSTSGSLSAGGRYVAFSSHAGNLVPADTNGAWDVFVHDRRTGVTERVSVRADGTEGNEASSSPQVGTDGRYVSFMSDASNLVPGDTNGVRDAFVHDRETGVTERVSVAGNGGQADDRSSLLHSSLSGDGRYIMFDSDATNLVPGDTNGVTDMFVRDRGPATGVGDVVARRQGDKVMVSGWARFAGQIVTSVDDPPDDGTSAAADARAEITGAMLTYRPESEDLLLRINLAGFPSDDQTCVVDDPVAVCDDDGALRPRVSYRVSFQVAGTRYEVRAHPGATLIVDGEETSDPPRVALYRCDPDCVEQAILGGGIGITGSEVRTAVSLEQLGASAAPELTAIRAYTVSEAGLTPAETYDEADLPDATTPQVSVRLGIAPGTVPPGEVSYTMPAEIADGRFTAAVDTVALRRHDSRLWVKACLGDVCGAHVIQVRLRPGRAT